jgi:hypothetical protein
MDLSLTDTDGNNPRSIVRGNLMIPRSGLWTADLLLGDDASLPPVGSRVTFNAYNTLRSGTVIEAGEEYLQLRVRVIGGEGKLETELPPQSYTGYALKDIASDILSEAGEYPKDLSGLPLNTQRWTRSRGPASSALRRVIRLQRSDGNQIRMLAEHTGEISIRTWTPYVFDSLNPRYTDLAIWPQDKEAYIGPDLNTTVEPEQIVSIFDRHVTIVRVLYELQEDVLRCKVWYEE